MRLLPPVISACAFGGVSLRLKHKRTDVRNEAKTVGTGNAGVYGETASKERAEAP
ncbi:MAG: hypothetical protein BWY09_01126 [Candidatus Hydrogenedentes bacterium ADurb.Bin179]|nr:MAG: hypothetical protein BWY09_01126 [Candidatus Hydrogenedentes bacterium ADurb.Bin179]